MSESPTSKPQASAVLWLADGRNAGDADLTPFIDWIGPSERRRYDGFLRAERQRQFLIGRALLRWALADFLQQPVASFAIEERPGLPPLLDEALPRTSLSHSGPWVACAISREDALGVDIERLDATRDVLSLAQQAFDAPEYAALAAVPAGQRLRSFYARWSEKEALFKLRAAMDAQAAPHCITLPHELLSIALCAGAVLADIDMRRVNVAQGRFVSCAG